MGFQADPLLMFDPMGSCSMVQAKKLMWSACNFLGEPIELVVHKHHNYRMEGNFRGVQYSWIGVPQNSRGEIFVDSTITNHTHLIS